MASLAPFGRIEGAAGGEEDFLRERCLRLASTSESAILIVWYTGIGNPLLGSSPTDRGAPFTV
ncbi:MAG: hypothetical protein AVDCRST_MAG93-8908 [uncultured Chloroflexia bacterium]|uniref:Uncharacterized protein n=1 Tax=uncultured Chloroflexia bacterium TaxID=1672391 RepID=A0A6J4N7L6_9CHLR|nr:MAG: hypothetical protein AVDCRST_MAG93-8908 [uncultured Chloroflexia bacterium]